MKMRREVENMKLKKAKNGIEVTGKKKNAKASSIGIVAITSALVLVGTLLFGVVGIASAQQTLPKGGDNFETAVELQPGCYVNDHDIPYDTPEFFKLTVKAGQAFIVNVTNPTERAAGRYSKDITSNTLFYDEKFQPMPLELDDPDARPLTRYLHGAEGSGTWSWLPNSEKSLYIYSMHCSATKGTKYDISLEDKFDAGSKTDAGESFETAMEITSGVYKGYLSGEWVGTDAKDIYKLHVEKGDILTVKMTAKGACLGGFKIYESDREPLFGSMAEMPCGPFFLQHDILISDDIFISIDYTDWYKNNFAEYVLEITTGAEAPSITPTSIPTTTPTSTPTVTPTLLATSEDPFNYQGEYTLDANELTDEEKAALDYVMKYAKEYKVSPCLIMAVIRQESNFDASANDGADVGYMQVMYDAAKDGGYKGTEQEWQQEDGFDPDQNIEYGAKYLRALNDIFRKGKLLLGDLKATKVPDQTERLKFVLAAYNGGASRIASAQQICEDEGDNPEKWDDVKEYLEAAGATPEKAEIIKKYVEQVIEGRDFIEGQRRGYEFFLTIRVPEVGVPGFEAVFAIAGLLAVAYLLRRKK
jgi:PGF-CTERM protein